MRSGFRESFQRTFHILVPFAVYFVVHDVAQILMAFVLNLSMEKGSQEYIDFLMANAASVSGIISAASMLTGAAFIWPMAKSEIQRLTKKEEQPVAMSSKITGYCFLGALAFTASVGINMLFMLLGFSQSSADYARVAQTQYGVSFVIGIFLYGLISPVVEELVFRGLIYNRMKTFNPVGVSMVVSSLLFGIYHGNIVQAVYGTILGLLIVAMYEVYGGFEAPVLFHAIANISVYSISYITESYHNIVTPLNCVIYLSISVILFFFILRSKKGKNFFSKK